MLQIITKKLLLETATEIIEEAAFIFTEQAEEEAERSNSWFEASMDVYNKGKTLTLWMLAEKEFGTQLAANFLGIDVNSEEARQKGAQALGELLNILSGALMERLFGSEALLDYGLPMVNFCSRPNLAQNDYTGVSLVSEEGRRICLALEIEENP